MAAWGSKHGFDVRTFTDEGTAKVRVADIFDAVQEMVAANSYGQLIVYFSGHGLLMASSVEVWLLSGAPDNPGESINLSTSLAYGRFSGIPHIAIISDACRSTPSTREFGALIPNSIFPTKMHGKRPPRIDQFFATRPGDPAWELPPLEASNQYLAVFSSCMMKALKGEVAEILEPHATDRNVKVVAPRPVRDFLEVAVPQAASDFDIKLKQDPEIRIESDPGVYFSEFPARPELPDPPTVGTPAHTPASPGAGMIESDGGAGSSFDYASPPSDRKVPARPPNTATPPTRSRTSSKDSAYRRAYEDHFALMDATSNRPISPAEIAVREKELGKRLGQIIQSANDPDAVSVAATRLLKARGRKSFETQTGFSVIGAAIRKGMLLRHDCDIFSEGDGMHLRVRADYVVDGVVDDARIHEPNLALIRFDDGFGTCLAVLPQFVGTVVVEDHRVVSVTYTPSATEKNGRFDDYSRNADAVDQRRAFAAIAARHGAFELAADQANDVDRYMRLAKSVDPALGVYAAYAYFQAGNIQGLYSVLDTMRSSGDPVLFDVAMLANFGSSERKPATAFPPFMPMMSQGWALLDGMKETMPAAAIEASRFLVPSLWTTFSPEGMDILEAALADKEKRDEFLRKG
jgi:hypothetical protein